MATIGYILQLKGSGVTTIPPSASAREAAAKMTATNVGALIVCDDSEILGIITERDFLGKVLTEGKDPTATTVREIMSSPVETCLSDELAEDCAQRMAAKHIRHMAVMDDGRLVGVVSQRDLMIAMHY